MSILPLRRYNAVAHTSEAEAEKRLPDEGPLGRAIFAVQSRSASTTSHIRGRFQTSWT